MHKCPTCDAVDVVCEEDLKGNAHCNKCGYDGTTGQFTHDLNNQVQWFLSLGPADRKNFGELHEKIKELEDALRDMGHALSFACSQLESCDCDQSVGFTCGNCCLHREYDKHKELLSKINEEKK